jgi:GTP-binding protein HflX
VYEIERRTVVRERAVLVGVLLPGRHQEQNPLEELEGLAEAAGAIVVGQLIQRRQAPDASTYLGRGKLQELADLVRQQNAEVVIFDNDLSPAQVRNLEKVLDVKVLDRTEVVLDIFASRARTHEARLAVELAQLEYLRPRLRRMWTHLSRLRKGIGLRGPGEKQLEVDRRLVDKRISDLRMALRQIERRKQREVAARSELPTVSLVGYTNAGKSTLLNRLTGADVFVADKLFATLDTRTRRWQIPGWGPVLLSDTVGFIRDLPHHLIASFKATLEEARQADLLLHVADGSNPAVGYQVAAAYRVLEEIGIETKDTLLVVNKIDIVQDRTAFDGLLNRYPHAIPISARTGESLDTLTAAVRETLGRGFVELLVELPVQSGKYLAFLAEHAEILSRQFEDNRMRIHCRIARRHLVYLQDPELRSRLSGNGDPAAASEGSSASSEICLQVLSHAE